MQRIDGRSSRDYRDLSIGFGLEYGSCIVSLGATKVMCNISYEIVEPKASKPCEGLLNIRLDLMAMMKHYRDKVVEILRVIEKNIVDSKCLDLESLCLIASERVFQLNADLIGINEDGNIAEASSIALIASLLHYKRPDFSVIDGEVKIHSFDERHPLPLNLLHLPFCTSFIFFGETIYVNDPLEAEELVCDGYLVVGANIYREITTIHISGRSMIDKKIVLACCNLAIDRSKFLTNFVKNSVQQDIDKRSTSSLTSDSANLLGYVPLIKSDSYVLCGYRKEAVKLSQMEQATTENEEMDIEFVNDVTSKTKTYRFAKDTVGIGEGGKSKWTFVEDFEDLDSDDEIEEGEIINDDDEVEQPKKREISNKSAKSNVELIVKHESKLHQEKKPIPEEVIVEDSDSSEEEVQILEPTFK